MQKFIITFSDSLSSLCSKVLLSECISIIYILLYNKKVNYFKEYH